MQNHIGQSTAIEIGGQQYTLARFSRKIMRQFLDWAAKILPDPIASIKELLAGFPANIQELIVKDALERSRLRHSFNSPEVQQLIQTPEGVFKLFCLLLSPNHPDITEDKLDQLFDQFLAEQAAKGEDGEAVLQQSFRPDGGTNAA